MQPLPSATLKPAASHSAEGPQKWYGVSCIRCSTSTRPATLQMTLNGDSNDNNRLARAKTLKLLASGISGGEGHMEASADAHADADVDAAAGAVGKGLGMFVKRNGIRHRARELVRRSFGALAAAVVIRSGMFSAQPAEAISPMPVTPLRKKVRLTLLASM